MQKKTKKRSHRQVYYDWYAEHVDNAATFIPCEITGLAMDWVHAIDADGMGGTKKEQPIENLIAVKRQVDYIFGDRTEFKPWLRSVHERYMKSLVPLRQRDDLTEEDRENLKKLLFKLTR